MESRYKKKRETMRLKSVEGRNVQGIKTWARCGKASAAPVWRLL
jgi:hypothetical protein